MTDIEFGWLAGIVDGEGCIGIHHAVRKEGYHVYDPSITISNTDNKMVIKIKRLLEEMKVYYTTQVQKRKGCRPIEHVRIRKDFHIQIFLMKIMPHLVTKKEQAFWVLEFEKEKGTHCRGYSKLCIEIAAKVSALNQGERSEFV